MAKINVLDSSVFNRIAAGEVVERPSSVLKELVENAVDSGATKIDIYIDNGGKYIKVIDNGCGIAYDELRTAFLPHATSKVKNIEDLDSIGTLGFRGEALPSIASVAKISVTSRKTDCEFGGKIVIENGRELCYEQIGAPIGTTVEVSDLFKNVPARLKFLKTDRSEESDVTGVAQKIIIANYKIAFSFFVKDKEVYRTEGKGLKEALYSIFGANYLKEHTYISSIMPDIALYGYVNKPAYSKHNKSYQTLIVNGRYVINSDVSFWIYNCFSDFLMKRQYPSYTIFVELPNDMVDVNVHPGKLEVKFVDFDRIRKMLSNAIKECLSAQTVIPKEIVLDVSDNAAKTGDTIYPDNAIGEIKCGTQSNNNQDDNNEEINYPTYKKSNFGLNSPNVFARDEFAPKIQIEPEKIVPRQFEIFHDIVALKSDAVSVVFDISDYSYCGKFFNTYLMMQKGDELIVIDQHAAHEKILYDKYCEVVENGKCSVQDLLIPYIFDVDADETELIEKNLNNLSALGFGIAPLSGNTFSLYSVPLVLSEISLKDFVSVLLESLKKGKITRQGFMKESLMQSACKSAVKGEMNLSDGEVEALIHAIKDRNIDLFCPHGRPVAVKIKKNEIEKWFKRIV